jgi:hypothetical protein
MDNKEDRRVLELGRVLGHSLEGRKLLHLLENNCET